MSTILHPNQNSVAKELGIAVADTASAEEAVAAIEVKLGKASIEVRARWFVISVLRHLSKEKWVGLDDSGLDEQSQRSLGQDCLAVDGFAASLGTVTKDNRSKFRFVGFASSKNIERGMLATGTKAYKIAAAVVQSAGLVEKKAEGASKKLKSKRRPRQLKDAETSVVGRRAKSGRDSNDELRKVADTVNVPAIENEAGSMSKEEFANLNAAMSKSDTDTEIVQQNWTDQPNEERWSRILGLIAGVGFFVFVALLFL